MRQKIILKFLKKYIHKTGSILNIGAAGGASTTWLSSLGNVTSLESDSFFIDHLKEQNIDVANASVTAMPYDENCFDIVCAFDVIEHVEDDLDAMNEIRRVCKPGGIICVTVPAFKMLWSTHDIVNGHIRRYTKKTLLALGRSSGLKCEEIKYFNSLLFIPILAARKVSALLPNKNKGIQSDFTSYKTGTFLNKIWKGIFAAEIPLLMILSFPFGVSLIGAWRKPGK